MAELTLTAETGRATGSRPSNRLRAEGKIPGVVYGLGSDPKTVTVDWRSLRQCLTTDAGLNALINLDIDGEEHLSIVKELQRNPVKRTVTHVDFILIDRDADIEVEVPVVLEGEATLVERENGTVTQALFSLTIIAKPGSIPDQVTADISELEVGGSIRVADLPLPSGVRTEVDPEDPVVLGEMTRASMDAAAEEAGEGAEGEGEGAAEASGEGSGGDAGGDARLIAGGGTPADLLVVGLGNPGAEYERSRHNVGAEVVALLAERHGARLRRSKEHAQADEVRAGAKRLALAVPLTYMNESGQAVAPLVRRYGVEDDLHALVVVHDELDLPVGRLKLKVGGGLAGHNGLRSIKAHLHSDDFVRVRIGVGKPPSKERGADHVLKRVPKAERVGLDIAVQQAADAVEAILDEGVAAAMNRFNALD